MKNALPIALAALLAEPSFAESARQFDAHEHGAGELNIAIEGQNVAMELHAPGADIVGFEYHAESVEDRAAIDAAVATLARPQELFALPTDAECTVIQASASLVAEKEHDENKEHEQPSHTEFHAEYLLNCTNPSAIDLMTFPYFTAFENARELEVQIVTSTGAQAYEVERDAPQLNLRGMF